MTHGMGLALFISCFKLNNRPNMSLRSSSGRSRSVDTGLCHSE